jgi:hypothetical protein
MLTRWRLWQALAAIVVFAALSLAPQAASAHSGHSHAPRTSEISQPSAHAERQAVCISSKPNLQVLTQADSTAPSTANRCDNLGCCSNGPCNGGCHGFLAASAPPTAPPALSSIVSMGDPPPRLDADRERLKRPPKSFV